MSNKNKFSRKNNKNYLNNKSKKFRYKKNNRHHNKLKLKNHRMILLQYMILYLKDNKKNSCEIMMISLISKDHYPDIYKILNLCLKKKIHFLVPHSLITAFNLSSMMISLNLITPNYTLRIFKIKWLMNNFNKNNQKL